MTKPLVTAVLIAAPALAGCARPGSVGPGATSSMTSTTTSAAGPLAAQLAGRSFETTGPGDVAGFSLVGDSKLTLKFGTDPDGKPIIGAYAGCNSMGGPVAWDGNTIRPTDGFARTEMACDSLMQQEDWYFALLNAGARLDFADPMLTISGTVSDAASDGSIGSTSIPTGPATITMVDSSIASPTAPLAGYTWRLDGMISGSGPDAPVSSVPADLTASMMFSVDPVDDHLRLDVFDGLGWLAAPGGYDAASGEYTGSVAIEPTAFASGGVTVDGLPDPLNASAGTVRVTGMASDAQGCAAEASPCRVAEMALLGSDFTFKTGGNRLTVMGTGEFDGHGLMFVVDPTAPTPDLNVLLAAVDNPLLGKTFDLTRTFTDAGGADHKHADASLKLTFGASSVAAQGSCGDFGYDDVRYIADPKQQDELQYVDLGSPSIAGCVIGDDPPMPPDGKLMYGTEVSQVAGGDGSEMWLSTGFVAWYFRPAP